jgi:hypothetical protein
MRIEDVVTDSLFESIEYDMPFEAYCESTALNASTLKAGWVGRQGKSISMRAIKYAFENGRKDTEAMLFGRCLHCLLLEPDSFEKRYAAFDGVRNKKSAAYQAFLKDHADAEVLKKSGQYSWDSAMHAAKMLLRSTEVEELTEHGKHEVTVFTPELDMQMRVRLDLISTSAKKLVDVKTAKDVTDFGFGCQFFELKYDVQLGLYRYVFRKVFGHDWPVAVIAIENVPPHDVVVYDIPDAVLDQGTEKAFDMMRRVRHCIDTGEWPGVSGGVVRPLLTPNWAMETEVEWSEELVQ